MTQQVKKIGVMWDIESLALDPKAVVTQAAFVAFDLEDPGMILREVEEYLPIDPQLTMKRSIRAATLIWWMKQSDEARAKFDLNDGDDFDELTALANSLIRKFNQVIEGAEEVQVWARGPQFDIVVLESLFNDLGQTAPWKYDSIMDLRTTMKNAGVKTSEVPKAIGHIDHHALSDCHYQIACLVEANRRTHSKV